MRPRANTALLRTVRMRLKRTDGAVFLDRWGIESARVGGIFLHRMRAADPGEELHDHPWSFASLVLWGGYTELRAETRAACQLAEIAEELHDTCKRGVEVRRRWLSVRTMRLDECHRIIGLARPTTWTLVLHGPHRRKWGFYEPAGWIQEHAYDATRVRPLFNDHVGQTPDCTCRVAGGERHVPLFPAECIVHGSR